jgi:SAM-dependent methyltransferase
MVARDPHRFVNELDESAINRLIDRLESRAKDAVFARLFDHYVDRLALPPGARVLEIGCGTGAMVRRLAQRGDFIGQLVGIDQSPCFIEAAGRFASMESIGDRIEFGVGDAHALEHPAASFDVVIAHTLISHVTEPLAVIREMARVVRPGGALVIFDGDYASLTFAYPDHDFGHQMDVALAEVTFNNPRIMRELPRLVPGLGLKLADAWGEAVVEIGHGSYFRSFAEAYAPYVVKARLLPAGLVDTWLRGQRQSIESGTFFAACNYYTYFVRHI